MSRDASNSDWLERNLESARRRVNQLEIDACRIRTDLARLEVANATGMVNDDLASSAGGEASNTAQAVAIGAYENAIDWQPAAGAIPDGMDILVGEPPRMVAKPQAEDLQQVNASAAVTDLSWASAIFNRSRGMYRWATSPMIASLIVHGAILVLAVTITVASIEQNDLGSTTTTLVLGEKPAKESENFVPEQLADLGATGVQNVVADLPKFDMVGPLEQAPIPIDLDSVSSPETLRKMGLRSTVDADGGKMAAGAGGLATEGQGAGNGLAGGAPRGGHADTRKGGRQDSTLFFGTEARGNRFVFVVDNSSSMKGRTAANRFAGLEFGQ